MNINILIVEGEFPTGVNSPLSNWRPSDWRTWVNCKSLLEAVSIASHRHIRDRGGVASKVQFHIFAYDLDEWPDKPRYLYGQTLLAEPDQALVQ